MERPKKHLSPDPSACLEGENGPRTVSHPAAPCLSFPTCRSVVKEGGGEVMKHLEGELLAVEIDR